jgi:8-oxo-dGTP pyrophosphatase MutT (NUDIX family)
MRAPNRVIGLIIRGGKILLIHRFRNGNDFWVFPGGIAEGLEDPNTVINWVIREETGLKPISSLHLFDEYDEHAFIWYFYACELEPGDPKLGGPEAEEQTSTNRYLLEWVDPNQITELNLYPLPSRLIDFVRTNTGSVGGMAFSESRVESTAENRVEPITGSRVESITATV